MVGFEAVISYLCKGTRKLVLAVQTVGYKYK